ncbi:MAG: Rho termination factor N-terminal domain-containing protein, partial [Candidatus Nanopelagicales bacterium]|nr:Rho termination factor N-terminal domain-containing protein [Candidatus Nanopelagicales bacterium]
MTDTDVTASASSKGKGLSSMLLPELKQMAQQMGISGASGMRKGDLVAAISERQGGSAGGAKERPQRSSRRGAAQAE